MSENPELIDGVFDAWLGGMSRFELGEIRQPIMQAEVISLACVWALANVRLGKRPHTVFQFTQDFMLHEKIGKIWTKFAADAGDIVADFEQLPYQNQLDAKQLQGPYSPYRFDDFALQDGRPRPINQYISGTELSLIGNLAHAVYNSTDGNQLIVLQPKLGPPDNNPRAFLTSCGENMLEFIAANALLSK
jgi:hypothetical protein